MRFELPPGPDPLAIRLALAACADPLRLERSATALALVVTDADAERARGRWLRAGIEAARVSDWPVLAAARGGVLEADGRCWCIGRASLVTGTARADLVLRCAPVSRDDALRAIVRALVGRLRSPLRRGVRQLACAASRIASGADGVVAARVYLVAGGATPAEAVRIWEAASRGMRPAPWRLRSGALAAWHDVGRPAGGVWRTLAALERWWS